MAEVYSHQYSEGADGGIARSLSHFLFPGTFTTNSALTFSIRDAIVAVAVVEDINASHLRKLADGTGLQFFTLLQRFRHDVWAGMAHMGISFEDMWVHVGPGFGLATIPAAARFLKSDNDVALVVAVPRRHTRDAGAVLVALAACLRSPNCLRSVSAFINLLVPRHSRLSCGLRSVTAAFGDAFTRSEADDLQRLPYLGSANTLEEALGQARDAVAVREAEAEATARRPPQHATADDFQLFLLARARHTLEEECHRQQRLEQEQRQARLLQRQQQQQQMQQQHERQQQQQQQPRHQQESLSHSFSRPRFYAGSAATPLAIADRHRNTTDAYERESEGPSDGSGSGSGGGGGGWGDARTNHGPVPTIALTTGHVTDARGRPSPTRHGHAMSVRRYLARREAASAAAYSADHHASASDDGSGDAGRTRAEVPFYNPATGRVATYEPMPPYDSG